MIYNLGSFYKVITESNETFLVRCVSSEVDDNYKRFLFKKFEEKRNILFGDSFELGKMWDIIEVAKVPQHWYYADELWTSYL